MINTAISVSKPMGFNFTLLLNISFLIVFCSFLSVHFFSSEHFALTKHLSYGGTSTEKGCNDFHSLSDYREKCLYLKSNDPCVTQGYIDYLYLFYCKFGEFPLLGHTLLFLWLLVLFYLLANTASEYFCPSLENLSKLLWLSPTIAGVTLLSLGNGASDVFATLVSFNGSETRGIGFNTVLGGASFVSCVVVGIVSLSIRHRRIQVKKSALIRDVCFLLFVLLCLFAILIAGEINVLGAISFCMMYVVYVIIVYVSSTRWKGLCGDDDEGDGESSCGSDLDVPLLNGMEKGLIPNSENGSQECGFNIWKNCYCQKTSICGMSPFFILELPLYLPRRLTIPIVSEEKWSKPYAVSSALLAPILVSSLWLPGGGDESSFNSSLIVYGIGIMVGIILAITAFLTTEAVNPPRKYLFPWLAGGFVMSVTWSYISAQELVGLLVSIGYISGVSPSILGLTVLAWGNSLNDLVTNLTMALHDGSEGAQIAISGCYAGPIFNTVVGLGLSLACSTWSEYPSSVFIPKDPYLWETLALLVVGLIWALVVLLRRDMRLDATLGGGLLVIYFISLFLRLIQTSGSHQFENLLGLVLRRR